LPLRHGFVSAFLTPSKDNLSDQAVGLNYQYIEKMEDVLETYERPYDVQEPVVCFDEKPVALHADIRPPSPAAPGGEARRDSEYERKRLRKPS